MTHLKDSGMDFIKQTKNMIFKQTIFVPSGGNKKMNKSRLIPQPSSHLNSSPSSKIETFLLEKGNNWKCLLSNYWLKEAQVFLFSVSNIPQHCCPLQRTTLSGQYLLVCDGKTQISSQHTQQKVAISNLETVEASTDSNSHLLLYIMSSYYFPGTGDFLSFKE